MPVAVEGWSAMNRKCSTNFPPSPQLSATWGEGGFPLPRWAGGKVFLRISRRSVAFLKTSNDHRPVERNVWILERVKKRGTSAFRVIPAKAGIQAF